MKEVKWVDCLFKILTNRATFTMLAVMCVFVPGVLTVLIFNHEIFIKIDVVKLIILSVSLSIPLLCLLNLVMGIRLSCNSSMSTVRIFYLSMICNGFVLYILLLVKQMLGVSINIFIVSQLIIGIILGLIVGELFKNDKGLKEAK